MLSIKNAVIILYGTRFPENVGMIARACANLGCQHLRLVNPERYDEFRAWPLATRIGQPVLRNARIFTNISAATKDLYTLFGTSARVGGRRKAMAPSHLAALSLKESGIYSEDKLFGILFGPEDRGLSNTELSLCQNIINIPAVPGSSSFNIAQSVLIILYELSRIQTSPCAKPETDMERIRLGDLERLENELKDLLILSSVLPEKNPDYFFIQWHDMLSRLKLKRHEYDALMGLCRKLKRKINLCK